MLDCFWCLVLQLHPFCHNLLLMRQKFMHDSLLELICFNMLAACVQMLDLAAGPVTHSTECWLHCCCELLMSECMCTAVSHDCVLSTNKLLMLLCSMWLLQVCLLLQNLVKSNHIREMCAFTQSVCASRALRFAHAARQMPWGVAERTADRTKCFHNW